MPNYLTTDNPRLRGLVDCFYTQSPEVFLKNSMIPYVSIEHARQLFLRKETFDFIKRHRDGNVSFTINDLTVSQDYQTWVGICRFLSFCTKCLDEGRYGADIKVEIKYSIANQIRKRWQIDYNEYLGLIVFTVNSSLRSDNSSLKSNLARAALFAFNVSKDMLTRLKAVSSEDAYRKMAYTIVIETAF